MPGDLRDDLAMGPHERDPMRAAQRDPVPPRPRRFYEKVAVVARDGLFAITLDGKLARTPRRNPLALPTAAAAEAVAAEWAAQGQTIDPSTMPMTRIVNAALDGVAGALAAVQADVVKYAGTDLLCYRAEAPEALVAAQAAAWDPVLGWARDVLGARFVLTQGVMFVEQPPASIDRVRAAVSAFTDPLALACLHAITTLCGSALLALAVARGDLSAEAAWSAAHVDEDFQAKVWGADRETLDRTARRWRDMAAAAGLLERLH
jgi:chaperone required for assembly of F1-ATPase